ncbi:DNA polymerase III subunit alpha [Dongia deserti]|uniref:DNA polymerase III subunit alpha n=1 Tax=Dongia deserti TaxID=2268030 RepID=UPI000E658700|nr:DNA polymerase III subunit alpha [Dongia deserti]
MPYADFVHLRVHSAYSLSEGAIKPKQLVELARRQQMPAVAVTDTGNLFGAMEFSSYAKDAGVQPIIGCQMSVTRPDEPEGPGQRPTPDQLVLLVQNEAGYRNLMKLSSAAFLETEPGLVPQVSIARLAEHAEGLLALTGGVAGEVGRHLLENRPDAARASLDRLKGIFPGRLYMELQRHGLPQENQTEEGLVELAYATDLPLIATNDVFFSDEGMFAAHDALLCIAQGAYVDQPGRRRVTAEHRFKSAREMRELFRDLPEAVDNTLVVARRCAFMPPTRKPILPGFEEGADEATVLRDKANEGLELRFQALGIEGEARKPYLDRLEFELGVIIQMGFPGYFLIVSEFIQWAKKESIPVGPGRGSGAGSVVAWALTITDLDPLRFNLLFERFLNPERVSMPDFDIDFCQDRRDEVLRHVQERYGRDRVAQIITFGKLQARAALRDVGRVLQMPYGQVDRLCKMVPNNPANPVMLKDAIHSEPMLQQARDEDAAVARMLETALKLEGLYRHASTHAAGVVIGDRRLDELVPLYRDPRSDMPVTQFNMKDVEKAGLVKFDFLGLKTLTVLQTAVEHIKKSTSEAIDLTRLPLDDAKTYAMLANADATGVFQLESSGMRDVLKKLKPDRFEDIIAVVALYRPGPMDNIPRYINCKHGKEEPDYLHPSLEGILKETFGIMIYQEQVMQIAQVLSGYTLGGADLLRRAMGKKIKEEMEAQRKAFVDGAVARSVDADKAAQIFDQVNKFAGYGFNKSHAAAYALVAYQTAYLKANYPVEFLAASMTYELANTDKLNVFRQELTRQDIALLPPDINKSYPTFSVERQADGSLAVRYALAAVKNVGLGAIQAMVKAREEGGPFRDLADFCERIDPKSLNKRQLENLVLAGAFDSIHPNRKQVFEAVEQMLRQAAAVTEARTSFQSSLFGDAAKAKVMLSTTLDWSPMERLQHEFGAIGFYLSAHPLDAYGASLKRLDVVSHAELGSWMRARGSNRAKVAGLLLSKQEKTSAKGNRFAFLQLTDQSGMYEATIFSDRLQAAREHLEPGRALLLSVDIRAEEDNLRLMVNSVEPLDRAVANTAAGLRIFLRDAAAVNSLQKVLASAGRGKGKIELALDVPDKSWEVAVTLPGRYAVSGAVRGAVTAIPGVVAVQDT